jgi:hypothetical protein
MNPAPQMNPMAGGPASLTKMLREMYTKANMAAQESGQAAPDWATWLQSNGFQEGPDGLAIPASPDAVQKLINAQREYL